MEGGVARHASHSTGSTSISPATRSDESTTPVSAREEKGAALARGSRIGAGLHVVAMAVQSFGETAGLNGNHPSREPDWPLSRTGLGRTMSCRKSGYRIGRGGRANLFNRCAGRERPPENGPRLRMWAFRGGRSEDFSLQEGWAARTAAGHAVTDVMGCPPACVDLPGDLQPQRETPIESRDSSVSLAAASETAAHGTMCTSWIAHPAVPSARIRGRRIRART